MSKLEVLTGQLPLEPSKAPVPAPEERVQIGAQVSPKARLAYDLVRRRYGVSATEIINMAPLFFGFWRKDLREIDSMGVPWSRTWPAQRPISSESTWGSSENNPFASYLRSLAVADVDRGSDSRAAVQGFPRMSSTA